MWKVGDNFKNPYLQAGCNVLMLCARGMGSCCRLREGVMFWVNVLYVGVIVHGSGPRVVGESKRREAAWRQRERGERGREEGGDGGKGRREGGIGRERERERSLYSIPCWV